MAGKLRLALLIDADNVTPKYAAQILVLASALGSLGIRRVYGDWGKTTVGAWRQCVLEYSLQPVQQVAYVSGKNATDIAMIIDAMDLLHSGRIDGFCIASSDSDFTPLALRIREQGLKVFGFGSCNTPRSFVASCDHFSVLEPVADPKLPVKTVIQASESKIEQASTLGKKKLDEELRKILKEAVAASADASGWSTLAETGNHLRKKIPNFNVADYGFPRFGTMVEETGSYDFDRSLKTYKVVVLRPKTTV